MLTMETLFFISLAAAAARVLLYCCLVGLALVVIEEIGYPWCRLCVTWWCAFGYSLYTLDLWPLPFVIVVSNIYYKLLKKVLS